MRPNGGAWVVSASAACRRCVGNDVPPRQQHQLEDGPRALGEPRQHHDAPDDRTVQGLPVRPSGRGRQGVRPRARGPPVGDGGCNAIFDAKIGTRLALGFREMLNVALNW